MLHHTLSSATYQLPLVFSRKTNTPFLTPSCLYTPSDPSHREGGVSSSTGHLLVDTNTTYLFRSIHINGVLFLTAPGYHLRSCDRLSYQNTDGSQREYYWHAHKGRRRENTLSELWCGPWRQTLYRKCVFLHARAITACHNFIRLLSPMPISM